MPKTDTYVHLVGVNRPAPWKADQFHTVDLTSLQASVKAAVRRKVSHFIYVSVARAAPVMREYQAVRAVCEMIIGDSGLNATILRPWYVLGPRHFWPRLLLPFYKAAELIPATRSAALRLGIVTREELLRALLWTVENPADGVRYIDVPAIRSLASLHPEVSVEASTAKGLQLGG